MLNLSQIWLVGALAVQGWRLHTFTAGGVGSIPGQGTKMPHAMRQKKKMDTVSFWRVFIIPWAFPSFLAQKDVSDSSCTFSAPGTLVPFTAGYQFSNQDLGLQWAPGCWGVIASRSSQWTELENKCLCICTHTHMHLSLFLSLSLYIYIYNFFLMSWRTLLQISFFF